MAGSVVLTLQGMGESKDLCPQLGHRRPHPRHAKFLAFVMSNCGLSTLLPASGGGMHPHPQGLAQSRVLTALKPLGALPLPTPIWL